MKKHTVVKQGIWSLRKKPEILISEKGLCGACEQLAVKFCCRLPVVSSSTILLTTTSQFRNERLPNPLFPIYIKDIHKCRHGSDSESHDTEGRFVPDKFDAIFSKYTATHADALTEDELNKRLKANRNAYNFNGWILSYTEWKLLYWLAKDEEGLLHRDAVRGVYEGNVFDSDKRKA